MSNQTFDFHFKRTGYFFTLSEIVQNNNNQTSQTKDYTAAFFVIFELYFL